MSDFPSRRLNTSSLLHGKKIALLTNTAWNHWNYRRHLIGALIAQGAEVFLIAPDDRHRALLQQHFPQAHIVVLRHLARRSLSLWSNARTFWEVYTVLKKIGPHLLICFTIKPNIFGNLSAHRLGIPSIGVIEGLGYTGTAPLLLRWLLFRLYRYASRSVCRLIFLNYQDRAEFIKANAVVPEKTRVIKGVGIDTSHFSPLPAPAEGGGPVFLFVGRFLTEKGIREFVAAGKKVRVQLPQARFQILGSPDLGNPASILPRELEQWVRDGAVEYLGQTDDVRPWLAAADVLALPSYYHEGLPCSLLEGMAMGKPIITTDSAGCRDTVEEGKNGHIVPIADVEALAAAMLRLALLSPEKRAEMGRYGRRKVLREFCREVILPQYLQEAEICLGLKKGLHLGDF